jgi:4-alpha-glucanotransferase
MNLPGTAWPNWRWRLQPGSNDAKLAGRLRLLLRDYGRTGPEEERRRSYVRPRLRTGRRSRA